VVQYSGYLGHCIGDLGSSHRSAPPAFIRIDLVSIIVIVNTIVIIIAIVMIAVHMYATLV
jgi:cytochrome b subunit of formate dehydrogenase